MFLAAEDTIPKVFEEGGFVGGHFGAGWGDWIGNSLVWYAFSFVVIKLRTDLLAGN